MSNNVPWMMVIMMQWTEHWSLIGFALWTGPSTHRKWLFVPSSTVSCRPAVWVCVFHCDNQARHVCMRVPYSSIRLLWLPVQSAAALQDGSSVQPRMRSLCAQLGTSSPHRKWRRSWEGKGSSSATPAPLAPSLPMSPSMIRVLSQK